jgi:hypothetical protein
MKTLNVLSWGGGTQSTALILKMLDGEVKDNQGVPIKPDYIIFADTLNESKMVYDQIYKIINYVKVNYDFDIIVTKKNKELKSDEDIIELIKKGLKYRNSKYADLFQSHVLYFQGHTKSIDVMPFWVRDANGKVGKTPFKACTKTFKIDQIMKELRAQEKVRAFKKTDYKINLYIGYTVDEISRVKPNPLPYAENLFPLVDLYLSRYDCVNYVNDKLGFSPRSSVCNMCYANDFNKCYDVYINDKEGWDKLIILDNVMANKKGHNLDQDVFMFRWQAYLNKRLKDIDMDELMKIERKKPKQLSIYDLEQEMDCMGGCFL